MYIEIFYKDDNMANETKKSKKFTKSTIAMIVCLAVIGALIVTTILLAIIPTDKGIKFSRPDQMRIIYNNSTEANFESDTEEFKKIWDTYCKSGRQPVIGALFGGYAGEGMKAVYSVSAQDYADLLTKSTSSSSDESAKKFTVCFVWNSNNEQTMKNANGSEYVEETTQITPKFVAAYFEVSEDTSMITKTTYLRSTKDSDSSNKTHITYTGVANYGELYDLLNSMVDDKKFI